MTEMTRSDYVEDLIKYNYATVGAVVVKISSVLNLFNFLDTLNNSLFNELMKKSVYINTTHHYKYVCLSISIDTHSVGQYIFFPMEQNKIYFSNEYFRRHVVNKYYYNDILLNYKVAIDILETIITYKLSHYRHKRIKEILKNSGISIS